MIVMDIEKLLLCKTKGKGTTYYTIVNSDGKKWSIDRHTLRTGFEIYEPSTFKGKMLKQFSVLLSLSCVRKKMNIQVEKFILCQYLQNILENIYGRDYSISLFYGTPCIDQKVTIQIYKGNEILGYCKVGNSERVHALFEKEYHILTYFEMQKVSHVPRGIGVFREDTLSVFVQSTQKQVNSKISHEFGRLQVQFLEDLYNATKKKKRFEQTDYFQMIKSLEPDSFSLSQQSKGILRIVYTAVTESYREKEVEWGVIHGDFTPWNTCIVNEELFGFDFEYSLYNAPKEIDMWHFIIQKAIFEDRIGAEEIAFMIALKINGGKDLLGLYSYILFFTALYLDRGQKEDIRMVEEHLNIIAALMLLIEENQNAC